MNRKEFLKGLGMSSAAVFALITLHSCSSSSNVTVVPAGAVDFIIDLNDAQYANLKTNGGYIIKNQIVIAKTKDGTYVAVTQKCSHEGEMRVVYQSSSDRFYCSAHGALFSTKGVGLNNEGKNGLFTYKTELNGASLRIYS
ncbi:MAG: (2Fe-2S)-binding protein [Bacteroidetes bacterium]|nr:MAG: (2Fe-2S)-binding protein [Bacteroidota bacterium]